MYKTFSYRIKDSTVAKQLHKKSCAVNYVWNFCNETQKHALKWSKKWLTNFDLDKLVAGSSKDLGLNSTTLQDITSEYYTRRKQFKKAFLNWRSGKRSLDWIPFKSTGISFNKATGKTKYAGLAFNIWYSRPIEGIIKSGNISQDSQGRYYLNLVCKLPDFEGPTDHRNAVGIDLGLKDVATLSDGTHFEAPKLYRKAEPEIAKAQSKKQKRKVRKLHAKVKNQRKDFNHKISRAIVDRYSVIMIGDVCSSKLAQKRKLAKSVYDAGWYQLKTFLSYKALAKGGFAKEVDERYTTQACSECGCISDSSPKGVVGLSIRKWTCSECGVSHDRDINAARNILSSGRRALYRT